MKRLVLALATLAVLSRVSRRARHSRAHAHRGGPPSMVGCGSRRGRFTPGRATA